MFDNNLTTYGTFSLVLTGTAWGQLNFSQQVPAGTPIRIKVGTGVGLINLLGSITFRAYNSGVAVSQNYSAASLVTALDGEYTDEIVFIPQNASNVPVAYNQIRITIASLVSLDGGIRVFEAYFLQNSLVNCGGVKDVIYGSTATLVGGLNPVNNPTNAIDGNVNTFARLNSNVGLLDKTYLTTLFDDLSRAGDSIRVILRNPSGGLLDASLISQNLAITTYNDRAVAENLALNESFLRLTLLGGAGDKYELSYPASAPFNRVEVSLGQGLLSAFNSLEVYEISRALISSPIVESDGKDLAICEGEELTFEPSAPQAGDQFFWYDQAGNLIAGNINEFTIPQDLSVGNHQFRLGTQRSGCTNQTMQSTIQVTVNPQPQQEDIIINPQGGVLYEDGRIIYPVGATVDIDPNDSQLPAGSFSWYRNEEGVPLDGFVSDGGSFSVNPITQRLTISNTTAALFDDPIFLEYETPFGCQTIKEITLESFIILPSMVHLFNVRVKQGRQVDLTWELSNEQLQGTVTIQRAYADLEFVELASLPITSGEERVRMDFTDLNPLPGRNYYRLFVMKEGGSAGFYSEVRMAEVSDFGIPAFNVFPNPFTDHFYVKSTVDLAGPLVIALLDSRGAVLLSQNMDSLSSGELIEFQDLGHLSAGVYMLRLQTRNGSKAYRVIRQSER
ncbi:hypothetical protein J2X69_005004 [Algoriphagus sp. 4150]|uniref:T9SS type A sorting domain-containing protein n=1 Tax=Algoriphagus sp. 4150 TaxID=2817756 RepID=UPI00285C5C27|nr:T9SS type A sorting domain-containing protein [Algoriphagus sp. 4150]MDR7132630.1 hypothetical protein [Algoriphagus sp. 4150]